MVSSFSSHYHCSCELQYYISVDSLEEFVQIKNNNYKERKQNGLVFYPALAIMITILTETCRIYSGILTLTQNSYGNILKRNCYSHKQTDFVIINFTYNKNLVIQT